MLLTVVAVGVAVVLPLVSWRVRYGGRATWPGLIGNFTATLSAFVLALWWDRHRAVLAAQQVVDEEQDERRTELRRRLTGVQDELARLKASIEDTIEKGRTAKYFLPDLPTAAWTASGERLAALMADYRLVVDLGILYAQVDDLRWRLRLLSELWSQNLMEAEKFRGLVVTFAAEVRRNLD